MTEKQPPPMPEMLKSQSKPYHFLQTPNNLLSGWLERWGKMVARQPSICILIPLLITVILSSGLVYFQTFENSQVDLYLPSNPRYKQELATLEALFPMNQSLDVDFGRLTRLDSYARIIITADDGGDMLREEYFKKIVEIDKVVNNMTVNHEGIDYKYKDICLKSKKKCFVNPILTIVRKIKDVTARKFLLKYPLTVNLRAGKIYFFGLSLGGVVLDAEGNVETAKAVHLVYFVQSIKASPISKKWDKALAQTISELHVPNVSASFFSQGFLYSEMRRSFLALGPLVTCSAVALLILGACCGMARDWTRCKAFIGLAGLVSSILASLCAMGLCSILGIKFMAALGSVILVFIGMGFLDTLVLVATWRSTQHLGDDVEERLGATCRDCGLWMLLGPCVLVVSALLGVLCPSFPLLNILSVFILCGAPLLAFFQFTMVLGSLALAGRLERNRRHHVTCAPAAIGSQNILHRWMCTGGSEAEKDTAYRHWMMESCKDSLTKMSYSPIWKLAVLSGFVVYLSGGCYGLTQLAEGLDRRILTGYNTQLERFINLEMEYFRKYPVRIQILVNYTMDYSKPEVQREMDQMLKRFESLPNVVDSSLTESWLRLYLRFLDHKIAANMMDGYNLTDKYDFYRGLREVFFRLPLVSGLKRDVIFNEDYTEIVASRFLVHTYDLFTSQDERDLVVHLREVADSLPYPTTVYNLFFDVFEMHASVSKIPLVVTTVLSCVLFLVLLIFTGDFKTSALSVLSLFAVQTAVIGFAGLWTVEMDAISSTAFSTYIMMAAKLVSLIPYFYAKFKHESSHDRLCHSLMLSGSSLVMFFVTMVLSSIALFFANTTMFINQQKIMLLYIILATYQGLLVPPVILNGLNVNNHRRTLKINDVVVKEKTEIPEKF